MQRLVLEGLDDADGVVERLVVLAEGEAHHTRGEAVLRAAEEGRRRDDGQMPRLDQLVGELVVRERLQTPHNKPA
jgi:hypothetical protein